MLFKKRKQGELVYGLDIGSSAVKLVLMRDGVPQRAASAPLARGVIERGRIKDEKAVRQAIQMLIKREAVKIPKAGLNVSVSNTYALYKLLVTPGIEDPQERSDALQLMAAKSLEPQDAGDLQLRYSTLTEEYTALLASAPRANLEYRDLFASMGIKLAHLHFAPLALATLTSEPRYCYAVVDIGAELLSYSLVLDGHVHYMRVTPYGGNDANTMLVSAGLVDDFLIAETAKKENGLLESEYRDTLHAWADNVSQAINNTTEHASRETQHYPEVIYFTGGSTLMEGMSDHLQRYLGIVAEPLAVPMGFDVNEEHPVYHVAMSTCNDNSMDLLPRDNIPARRRRSEAKQQKKQKKEEVATGAQPLPEFIRTSADHVFRNKLLGLIAGLALILIAGGVLLHYATKHERDQTSKLRPELQSLVTTNRVSVIASQDYLTRNKTALIVQKSIVSDRTDLSTMQTISSYAKDINELTFQELEIKSNGVYHLSGQGSESAYNILVKKLQDTGLIVGKHQYSQELWTIDANLKGVQNG